VCPVREESDFPSLSLATLGTILIVAGVVLAGIVVLASLAKPGTGKTRGGAVIMVGPFPIIFGSDKQSARVLLILSIVLVGALIALFLLQEYY